MGAGSRRPSPRPSLAYACRGERVLHVAERLRPLHGAVLAASSARSLADFAGVEAAGRALDVGCGPGALTASSSTRLGAANVAAIDPVAGVRRGAREREPGVDVRQAPAEEIPFADDAFDFALAQLVVHFMADPVAGLREMARVTRPGGVVAACVWDYYGGHVAAVAVLGRRSRSSTRRRENESQLAGAREGHLGELFRAAGLADVQAVVALGRPSSSRASRSGGRRTSSASGPAAPTSRRSTTRGARSSASSAARACLRRRSRSRARRGPRAAQLRDARRASAVDSV